jgi:hypothetical protein
MYPASGQLSKTGVEIMTVGAPTKYKPAIGNEIINLMAEGLSITASAAALGFHRDTIYEWEKVHPDFSDSIKVARGKRTLFLERRLLGAVDGPIVTSSIFALKNACPDEWLEKQSVEHTGSGGGPLQFMTVYETKPADAGN